MTPGSRSCIPRWWTTAVFLHRPLRGGLTRSATRLAFARSARILAAADRRSLPSLNPLSGPLL